MRTKFFASVLAMPLLVAAKAVFNASQRSSSGEVAAETDEPTVRGRALDWAGKKARRRETADAP